MRKENHVFLIAAVTFLIGIFIGISSITNTVMTYPTNSFSEKQVMLPAVDGEGNGVAVPLNVEVKHGDGKVLTDIDKLLFWVDTQYSIQTARDVASNVTGIDTSQYDLIYSIGTNQTGVVGGPSAGAALTIATIAALTNESVKKNIIITGTINEDGTIGEIGGIYEKAKAAKDIGADLFLVPTGQSTFVNSVPEQTCEELFGFIYCETTYTEETVDIGKEVGIDIVEVANIQEAEKYFFG